MTAEEFRTAFMIGAKAMQSKIAAEFAGQDGDFKSAQRTLLCDLPEAPEPASSLLSQVLEPVPSQTVGLAEPCGALVWDSDGPLCGRPKGHSSDGGQCAGGHEERPRRSDPPTKSWTKEWVAR